MNTTIIFGTMSDWFNFWSIFPIVGLVSLWSCDFFFVHVELKSWIAGK